MEESGLVLQGGGTRGVYTSGVLDFFIEKKIAFPYVIGVSSGACNGAAYIAKQKGLGKRMYTKYIGDKRYISLSNFLREGSLLGMDFIFDELPNHIEPFDTEMFNKSKAKFWVVATCCNQGKAAYFEKSECADVFNVIRASCSLPFITKITHYKGKPLLDGGVSDPIPIQKSIDDGNQKNVIVLTSDVSYQMKPIFSSLWAKKKYSQYDKLCKSLCQSYEIYNNTIDYIKELEGANKIFVIKPSKRISSKIIEGNKNKLNYLYDMGFNDGEKSYEEMMRYLEEPLKS